MTVLSPAAERFQEQLTKIEAIATEVLASDDFQIFAPDHVQELVGALVERHPAMPWQIAVDGAKPEGVKLAIQKNLELLRADDAIIFEPCPSPEAFARTFAAHLSGVAPTEHQWRNQLTNAQGWGQAERRQHFQRICRDLVRRGKADLISRVPHPRNNTPDPVKDATLRTINTLGNSSRADPILLEQHGKIAGRAAPPVRTASVYDPYGVQHVMESQKAADYVRLRGWTYADPRAAAGPASVPVDGAENDDIGRTDVGLVLNTPRDTDEGPRVPHKLNAARAAAEAAGVEFDRSWGITRLAEETARATASSKE